MAAPAVVVAAAVAAAAVAATAVAVAAVAGRASWSSGPEGAGGTHPAK